MDDNSNPLENYSPFENADQISTTTTAVPTTSPTIGADIDDDEEIRAYEQRLNILESQLDSQTNILNAAQETGTLEPPPNWPKFYPLVHFDINEVPENLRHFVTSSFFGWCIMCATFGLNWIGCLTLLHAGEATDSPGSKIALATLYFFIVIPLALDLDAMAVYRILKSDSPSTLGYLKVFAALGVTTFFEGMLTIGLDSSGSCGLITMICLFTSGHWFIGMLSIIITAGLGFSTFTHYTLVKKLWAYYRGTEQGEHIQDNMKKTVAMMVVDTLNK